MFDRSVSRAYQLVLHTFVVIVAKPLVLIGMIDVRPEMSQCSTAFMNTNGVQSISNLNIGMSLIVVEVNIRAFTCFKLGSSYSCFSSL